MNVKPLKYIKPFKKTKLQTKFIKNLHQQNEPEYFNTLKSSPSEENWYPRQAVNTNITLLFGAICVLLFLTINTTGIDDELTNLINIWSVPLPIKNQGLNNNEWLLYIINK